MSPVVVLVGSPGSGKTTVGQLLAQRLGVSFIDADHEIERVAGKPISDIFVDDGEPHFRELEHQTIAETLQTCDGVLSLGGGAVLDARTREALRGHEVVWLVVSLPDAVSRVGLGHGRPMLAMNPRATLKHLLEQRTPLYDAVSTIEVDTAGRSADEIADGLAVFLEERS